MPDDISQKQIAFFEFWHLKCHRFQSGVAAYKEESKLDIL
jgi:hypothetical protein